MVTQIVILKVFRQAFHPHNPIRVMIGFYDEQNTQQGSQLLPAALFPKHIEEGQSVKLLVLNEKSDAST